MTEAEAADVPVGTYVYSLAKTNKEALAEAQLAIRQMQGHKVSYPVAFDLEDEATLGTLTRKEISRLLSHSVMRSARQDIHQFST